MSKREKYYLTDDIQTEKCAYRFIKYIHADQSLMGCKYLIYAVSIILKEPTKVQSLTGTDGIYERTARHFNAATAGSAERGIRHLCEKLYSEMSAEEYQQIFGTTKKITNKQLIETACNFIRYDMKD